MVDVGYLTAAHTTVLCKTYKSLGIKTPISWVVFYLALDVLVTDTDENLAGVDTSWVGGDGVGDRKQLIEASQSWQDTHVCTTRSVVTCPLGGSHDLH